MTLREDGVPTLLPAGGDRAAAGARPGVGAVRSDDEAARGRAVERLGLVGSAPEQRFDRITRLARRIFGVPMANVTLIDGDDFWVKSTAGMADLDSYPREDSFCDIATRRREALVVTDATQDPRFAGSVWVTGPAHLRFYAGVPVRDADDIVVGTFCLLDTEPRDFTTEQLEILLELGDWVREELIASGETSRARDVQQALMPLQSPELPGYEIAGLCVPAQSVGGDFYDWAMVGSDLAVTVSDVMGKGTGAAIISATVRAALHTAARRRASAGVGANVVAEVMNDVGRALAPDLSRTGAMVTLFLAYLSTSEHSLRWSDAGHGLAVAVAPDGTAQWLSGGGLPLGVQVDEQWTEQSRRIDPGETVLVFSDGLLDLLGGDRAAMDDIITVVRQTTTVDELIATVRSLARSIIAIDDITVVAVRRLPG